MITMMETPKRTRTSPEPTRARPVFSSEDFRLIRAAVLSHLQREDVQGTPDSVKFSHLYHRLGRL
ncbi:hypothetical protein NYR55_04785 [Sphingomonas sp. BGYR3]|uniref:hypothetical protein n=1 Tax=Sphingomonas sp. BGYR3 TaxID=2975483 RepID=UPI0021A4CE50|nr:hypothetical protein [Sphingomonas sp. BGYR3]MDG5487934.1 hypothetical protein [Sphingomonas sp. BGYR3]